MKTQLVSMILGMGTDKIHELCDVSNLKKLVKLELCYMKDHKYIYLIYHNQQNFVIFKEPK